MMFARSSLLLLLLAVSALLLAVHGEILLDQNATSETTGTRSLPQARMWQSFTPHSTGVLRSVDVYVGVTGAACEPLTLTFLVVDGLPQSFDELTQWADATSTTPSPSLMHRQTVTTTCAAAVCTARECLGWESLTLSSSVTVTENRVVSFALLHVSSAVGSNSPPRIGVVPVIVGNTGRSSLLVSPIFHTRFGQFAFRAYLDNGVGGSSGSSSVLKSNSGNDSTAGTASYAVAIGVIGAVAVIALITLFVVRARRGGQHQVTDATRAPADTTFMTAEQLRVASPREAWDYLQRTTASANARKLTVAETALSGPMRYAHESEDELFHDDANTSRSGSPSHRGRVSPMTGSSHTLAWQPTSGFGPVQRITVNAAPESPSSPSTNTTAVSAVTSAPATPAAAGETKKRRRLPTTPTSATVSTTAARTPKAPSLSAWSDSEGSPAAGPGSSTVTSPSKAAAATAAVVAEEEVEMDFLPPFVVKEGYTV